MAEEILEIPGKYFGAYLPMIVMLFLKKGVPIVRSSIPSKVIHPYSISNLKIPFILASQAMAKAPLSPPFFSSSFIQFLRRNH